MDSDLNIAVNADSDSNSSDTHQNGVNLNSQVEVNGQIAKIQAEMNEIKGVLLTLTHQFTSRFDEGNALRASNSRNPERIDKHTAEIKKNWVLAPVKVYFSEVFEVSGVCSDNCPYGFAGSCSLLSKYQSIS